MSHKQETKQSVSGNELQEFYRKISHITESTDGTEPQLLVRDWSPELFRDMRSEAEVLMLMHGQTTSDRYLYGVCSAVAAMKEENGGQLPPLTSQQYELDKQVQISHAAAEDQAALQYFGQLERLFIDKFPLTAALMSELGNDLSRRLEASQIDIIEGFEIGWRKAVITAMPLFVQE